MHIDGMIIGLESEYLRFEADSWYKHDQHQDIYIKVIDSGFLEKLYQTKKQGF